MEKQDQPEQESPAVDRVEESPVAKIGDLLVKHRLLAPGDLDKALEIQRKEQEQTSLPLGEILVEIGALSPSDLQALLKHPSLRKNLGPLAVQEGIVSKKDLEFLLQGLEEGESVDQLLLESGQVTEEQYRQLQKAQVNSPRLGELAIGLNLITEGDLQQALRIQKSPRMIGQILCDLNLVSPLDLNQILTKYKKHKDLGDILLTLSLVDERQLTHAKQQLGHGADSLGDILLQKGFVSRDQLYEGLSLQHNISFRRLDGFRYDARAKEELTRLINERYAQKHLLIPISLEENRFTVAGFKPEHTSRVEELRMMFSHLRFTCILIYPEKFEELFEQLYNKRPEGLVKESLGQDGDDDAIDFVEMDIDENLDGEEGEGSLYAASEVEVEEVVNFIVKYGLVNGASDIHIEQDRKGAKLRYRIDGILQDCNIAWLSKKLHDKVASIISRIKILSSLDITEKRLPQDGVFRITYYDKDLGQRFDLDFRVATCRAIVGENVTIRILDSRKANVGLDNLNHSAHVIDPLKTMLRSAAGMILVTGPTGSGKTSTLYAALQHVYNPGIKILTAEDPIEYSFPGIMQTQVNTKIGLTFARLLRSFLRLDPDVILVGEMRDEETSKIGFDAAQTGHLLLSTLHTNDAVSSVSRLLDLGVDYSQISSCLMGVLAQRLVRRVCPHCKEEYVPDEREWSVLFRKFPGNFMFVRGTGCDACSFSGYKGRTLISEIFSIDGEVSQALMKGLKEEEIRKVAFESGMRSMLENGLMKLDETTLEEIIRVVPYDMVKDFRMRRAAQDDVDFYMNLEKSKQAAAQPPDPAASPATFSLSDPDAEEETLDRMQEAYEALRERLDGPVPGVDLSRFKEFIRTSFHEIREKHGCNGLAFTIRGNNGKAEISAVPDR